MQINLSHYKPHNISLRPFKFFFEQLHWFLQLPNCFNKLYENECSTSYTRMNEVQSFESIMSVDMKVWIYSRKYRIYSNKRRGAYLIFHATSVALI